MNSQKNMKGKTGIALLAAGVLAASGMGAGFAGMAYAADPVTAAAGQIVINPADPSTTTEYNAYQIFKATIDDQDKATGVTWSNDTAQTTVVNFLKGSKGARVGNQTYDAWIQASGYMRGATVSDDDRNDPSNALGYINAMWNTVTDGDINAGSFAQELAKEIAKTSGITTDTVAASTAWSGHKAGSDSPAEEGWYLFTTKTPGAEGIYTNAIFQPVGGAAKNVTEKSQPVTFNKQVKEDSTNEWGKFADAEVGSDVPYKLTFTLPTDYAAYSTYKLEFEDTPSANALLIKPATVKVYVNGTELTEGITNSTTASKLDVKIANLKTAAPNAAAGQAVTIEYSATITADAVEAPVSNPNTAKVKYSNNPLADGLGEKESKAKVYDYAITIHKTGENDIDLKGAKFKIAQGNPDGNFYFKSDATAGDSWTNSFADAKEFETDQNGVFSVSGLDAGVTYYLVETHAPNQYVALTNPVQITITPTYTDGIITALTASASGNNATAAVTPIVPPASEGADPTGGAITVTVPNTKQPVTFALTGGLGPAVIVGAIIVVGGVAMFVTSRKKREEGEDVQ